MNEVFAGAIRTAIPEDAGDILEIYAPYITGTAVSFEEQVPSVDEKAMRIGNSPLWLVAVEDSSIRGYAYAEVFHPRSAYRWSTEVSIYLADSARGRGLGGLLLGELLEGLRGRGFVNALAGTTLPNPASVALFESFGFEKIAHQKKVGYKLGAWHDVGWWQLHLTDPTIPPPRSSDKFIGRVICVLLAIMRRSAPSTQSGIPRRGFTGPEGVGVRSE